MIERNGGRVEVESKINEGTTFRFYLKEYSLYINPRLKIKKLYRADIALKQIYCNTFYFVLSLTRSFIAAMGSRSCIIVSLYRIVTVLSSFV